MIFHHLRPLRASLIATLLLIFFVASAPLQADLITVPAIEVQTLTHSFTAAATFPFPRPATSRDYISIGSGYTGGGGFSIPSITTGDVATIRVQAPAGQRFVIHDANATLGVNVYWQAGADAISLAGGTVTFENLVGSTPPATYSFPGIGNSGNVIKAEYTFQPAGLIEFTALSFTIPVLSSPASGARTFGSVQSSGSFAFFASATGGTNHTVMSLQAIAVPEGSAFLLVGAIGVGAWGAAWYRGRRESAVR